MIDYNVVLLFLARCQAKAQLADNFEWAARLNVEWHKVHNLKYQKEMRRGK